MKIKAECISCHDIEWIYTEQKICWRCERIQRGLKVAKPHSEIGWFFWNFRLNAWMDKPSQEDEMLPEWGEEGYL